ncbi:MAG: universal stress protein [Polyangiaceae bacterium]|jgi:nucleotide-binding universal stress UspA family protein
MLALKTILVPFDFDKSTDAALDAAIDLARMTEARIILFHAWDATWAYDEPSFRMNDITLEIGKAARASVEKKLQEVRAKWPRTTALVRQGTTWQTVLDVIREEKCDLVVIGTHGNRGLAHAFLGSVAEKIVRTSPVPVLTVRGPATRG